MSDLSIKYNDQVIGTLDDSGTATLKTANKKCVSDIEVEYTKPSGGTVGNALTLINNISTETGIDSIYGGGDQIIANNLLGGLFANGMETASGLVFSYQDSDDSKYYVSLDVHAPADNVDVTVNNVPLTYHPAGIEGYYPYKSSGFDDPIVGQTYTVVITNKE